MYSRLKEKILEIAQYGWAPYLIIFLFGVLYVSVGYNLYINNFYQNDGFRYFSALRNSLTGNFMYEGPTFQFLFANHTYFILVFLIPLVAIFKTPVILLLAGIMAILISAIYLIKIAEIKKIPKFYTILFSILYLMSPMISQAALGYGDALLQPDVFSAPLIFAFTYYYLKEKSWQSCVVTILFIFVKEENVVWFPMLWLLLMYFDGRFKSKDKYILVSFLLSSVFVVVSLIYFRSAAEYIYVVKELSFSPKILSNWFIFFLHYIKLSFFLIIAGIVPFIFCLKNNIFFRKILLGFIIVIICRVMAGMVIFGGKVVDIHYWGNTITYACLSIIFLHFSSYLFLESGNNIFNKKLLYFFIIFAILAICAYHIVSIYRVPTNLVKGLFLVNEPIGVISEPELLYIKNRFPPLHYPGKETLVVPYRLVKFFINDRSFMSPDFFEIVKGRQLKDAFKFVVGGIIEKSTATQVDKDNIRLNNLCDWFETKNYSVYWRCDLMPVKLK